VDRVVAHSVGVSYPAINPSVLASLKVVVPPLDEQRAIAAFLDRETARIDALIANKHRQIELLQEKRQAVITQAVTRGLDPNAPMKDSGVEWIGEIPADWQVKRLKYISLHVTVGIVVTPAKFYVAEGIPCLRSLNVRDGSLTDNNLVFISPESHDNHAKSRLRTGDIVAVRSGHPGSAAVVDDRYDDANCIDLIIIRRSRTFEPQFLAYAMASQCVRSQFEAGSGGAIQQHFNIETANNLLIALPPLATQIAIRSSLDKELGDLRALEGSIAQSVATLLEYRTALISAAVTGKIDVRDTAAVQRHTAPLPFRRVVLGAEIIQRLLDDPHFGRTKFEKALYLCEHHLGIELEGTYRRKAAGPLDGRMLYGMEAMLARQKWYGIDESPGRVRYVPLEKAGAHDRYFERYWGQHREALDTFLALFRQLHTERCEIVATLYAAWNDLVLTGGYFTDADIIREVRERWHERKERFTEDRLQRALGWMRKHGLVPTGRGRPTLFNGTDAATGEPS
jgi:type I restriction enzyme S subunit